MKRLLSLFALVVFLQGVCAVAGRGEAAAEEMPSGVLMGMRLEKAEQREEVKRALDEYKVDGLYFDGVSYDFRTSYEIVRKTRAMLGDKRILFRHCTADPLESNRIYCPFIDTYCDYIYRGEAGRAELELDDFLRWTVSGYNISNAVGYWVYTGSTGKPGYVRQAPTREHIDAALRHEVRIPRTEIGYELNLGWAPGDGHLEFFDKHYYGELDRLGKEKKKW